MKAMLAGLRMHCIEALEGTYPNSDEATRLKEVIGQVGVMKVMFEEIYLSYLHLMELEYVMWSQAGYSVDWAIESMYQRHVRDCEKPKDCMTLTTLTLMRANTAVIAREMKEGA
jgi:hypothetical protein